MAGRVDTAWAGALLDYTTGRAVVHAAPRPVYLALCKSVAAGGVASTAGANGTELTTAGYARQAVTHGTAAGAAGAPSGTPRTTANTALVTFGPFAADPPEAGFAELWDSLVAGNRLYSFDLDEAKDAANGESIQFAIGSLSENLA